MKLKVCALATAVALGGIAMTINSVSADVVCNGEHECWHSTEHLTYPKGVTVHADDWKWKGDRYHWHEHEGRGYWKGGVWVTL